MEQRVSAILLAAGQSRRMGVCKQLLPLNGKPAITHCIDAMIMARIEEIVVVVGPKGDAVAEAVSVYPVKIARNNDPESDMAESVQVGLRRIAGSATGVLVSLADQPLIQPATYSLIQECHRLVPGHIIVPVYGGKKGHPSLFPCSVLNQLVKPLTLRDILRRHHALELPVPVSDKGVTLDMDTIEDYKRMKGIYSFLATSRFHAASHDPAIPSMCSGF